MIRLSITLKKYIVAALIMCMVLGNYMPVAAANLNNGDKINQGITYKKASENKADKDTKDAENDVSSDQVTENEIVRINTAEDFRDFVEACKYDSYSVGKTFELGRDIEISFSGFTGVPYFNGTFHGNGHSVTIPLTNIKGSDYGFFRYVGKMGSVNDLTVIGSIKVSGSGKNIGGVVGVNYGSVSCCSYSGNIEGNESVGGVVGLNKNDAIIYSCSANGSVLGTDLTGGICGNNEGIIMDSENYSEINANEYDPTLDLSDSVDIGAFNITKSLINRTDIGGIAGDSSGIIVSCINHGDVGYNHSGYNVGGIAGRQSGEIIGCTNEGNIYGRKDIGGIVGQAEPYIESEYMDDKLNTAKDDINRLSDSITGINSAIQNATSDSSKYVNELVTQYGKDLDSIKSGIEEITQTVSDNKPNTKEYIVSINKAMENIENLSKQTPSLSSVSFNASNIKELRENVESVSVNSTNVKELQDNMKVLYDNLSKLEDSYSVSENDTKEALTKFADQIKDTGEYESVDNLVKSVDAGTNSILNSINATTGQLQHMSNTLSDDIEKLTSDEARIRDISSLDTISSNGVISRCINNGDVSGDINVAGIAGAANIEYEYDPELDLDFSEKLNIRLRTSVNDVIVYCENHGDVISKRNCAAGIVGFQEFGLIYDCESYGNIESEDGDYVSGVAGESYGTVQNCYSLSRLTGNAYVGGIVGMGTDVIACVSLSSFEAEGEYIGCVAGYIAEDGTVKDNYFINDNYEGIDGISYRGMAERTDYDTIAKLDSVPGNFDTVRVTFYLEDEEFSENTIPYGAELLPGDYPQIPEKEGYYVAWEELKDTIIKSNIIIRAEYIPWTGSVAGTILNDLGNPVFLISGEFRKEASLSMTEVAGPTDIEENETLLYAYGWSMDNVDDEHLDELTGSFYVGKDVKDASLYLLVDDKWEKCDSSLDGSYLTADIPYGSSFAVTTIHKDNTIFYIAGGCALFVLIIIISSIKRRKLKKLLREKEEEIRKRDIIDKMKEN